MKKILNFRTKKQKKERTKKAVGVPHGPTKEEAEEQLVRELMASKKVVENINDSCDIFLKAMQGIRKKYDCLQFQLIEQDLESILGHIDNLQENGPMEAHRDVPLEESEMPMENL